MRRGVPGVPNGILSCPVLPMPLASVTFGGSPIFASRTVVVSVFLRFSTVVQVNPGVPFHEITSQYG